MTELISEIIPVTIEDELKQSYMEYAMSVIVGRALPDACDGLKPVHRRILYAMDELGNSWNKPYKKSARVVGDVIGKYHPHGDSAVYDAIVRMAQSFSLRYMLIDGQGNFGSVDGDSAAAMRYTEIRMSKITHYLLEDLDKDTVDFAPNYDGSEKIPEVLPTKIPNLLINGSSGIAVGMATNIPPHNMTEVINACLALLEDEQLTIDDLIEYIKGPDFPTAAIISGKSGIIKAYRTGKGKIYIRSKAEIETSEKLNKQTIIITELPYQVNKARLLEKIAELVKDKKIEGISEIRDESDKDGMRVVIEVRRNDSAEVLLNNLYAQTQLECSFGINLVALLNGKPELLNLKQLLQAFLTHRKQVVTRRTVFELKNAKNKGHLLEGLAVALSNIDLMIEIVKTSETPQIAKSKLLAHNWDCGFVKKLLQEHNTGGCTLEDLSEEFGIKENYYRLSPQQSQAILEMRLHKLTGLEHEKLLEEYKIILKKIEEMQTILASEDELRKVIREELVSMNNDFGDERKTEIIGSRLDLSDEDLIPEDDMLVTLSNQGYAKTTSLSVYQAQKRGGRGKSGAIVKDEDFVKNMLIANTHTHILCFSTHGKIYWLKTYQLPQSSRNTKGKPIVNLLPLDENEKITTMLPVNEFKEGCFILIVTKLGKVKKFPLPILSRVRKSGLIGISLDENDSVLDAQVTNGDGQIMLFSSSGKAVMFNESYIRPSGRTSMGVRGMLLGKDETVISLIIPEDGIQILTASLNGFGKRTELDKFRITSRGTRGVIAMQQDQRNGPVVAAIAVKGDEEVMLISDQGTLVRTRVNEISLSGRNTKGVKLINLAENEKLVGLSRVSDDFLSNENNEDLPEEILSDENLPVSE
jgi:DNA gyrase subunit A